ncbi:MAG: DUF2703 domain-containing protein [Geobacteraceae bacterium]|nr:DUF2703 domain-containing protein [Geobacteraceae bacterium]
MKTLKIRWQRLVSEGQTCPRCGATGEEVEKAIAALKQSLKSLDIDVQLEKAELSAELFKKDTLQSNMIWINDRLLEDWIGGTYGQSQCCEVCGTNDCRTVSVGKEVFEVVPAELVIKAGLMVASQLSGPETSRDSQLQGSCCPH